MRKPPQSNIIFSLVFFYIGLLNAVPLPQSATGQQNGLTPLGNLSGETIVWGVLLIIGGLILAFFGHRFFNLILFLAGAYTGGFIAYVILVNNEPAGGWSNREVIIIVVVLVVALVSGLITLCLWRLGLSLIGGLAGLALGFFILSWVSGGTIQSQTGRIILLVVLSVIGAIVIHFLTKPLIIIGTAIVGAYSFICGVDVFAQTGFTLATRQFLNDRNAQNLSAFTVNDRMYGMLAGFIATAIVGAIVQFAHTRTYTWQQPSTFVRYPYSGGHYNRGAGADSAAARGGKHHFWS